MPLERLDKVGIHKIRPDNYVEPEKKPTFGNDGRVYCLAPYRMTEGQKPLYISYAEFGLAMKLSKAGGLSVDGCTVFDRTTVRDVTKAIVAARTRAPQLFDEPTEAFADRFLAFLQRDGACGFFLKREFR